ncbi:MAG: YraN family protein [Candidatus Omnitrophica bacterium]|nr:YraN family protein [Candidatus Omnitrophota bacterium]
MKSHELGHDGEKFACDFLARQGYRILEANYRTRFGEVDVVAEERGMLCFVEIKTRTADGLEAFEAVDRRKQGRMVRVAQAYLVEKRGTVDVAARFDVLAVNRDVEGRFSGELLRDAFGI